MMLSLAISAFILGIAFCAPPGIVTTETIRRGLARGFRPALFVQFGSLVGDSTWALIALTGLAFLIQNNLVRVALSSMGIILLLKLAWDALQSARKGFVIGSSSVSERGDFATGAVLSLSNPMNIVFWTGLGATAFAGITGGPQLPHFVTFFFGFLGGAVVWCFFMAALVAWGRRFINARFFRVVNIVCGLALMYFGLQLAYQLYQSLA